MKQIVAITSVILCCTSQGASTVPAKNIIDIHCHTAGVGFGNSGCFISRRLQNSWKYNVYLKAFCVTEQALRSHGDRLVIQKLSEKIADSQFVSAAVVLALDGVVDHDGDLDRDKTEMYIPNEFVAKEVMQYPNLLFGASVNPYRRDALERLEKASSDGAVLLKWIPSIQNIDPADERLIPFYLKMKELGLPLLTHTGREESFTRSNDELSDPERLRLPLRLGVTVIAAHSACTGRSNGESNYDRFLRLCREYPNLYADISALTQANRLTYLTKVLNQPELRGRLLYGSDMPLINTLVVSPGAFLFRIKPSRMLEINRMKNPWDRDVMLKAEMGATAELFSLSSKIIKRQVQHSSNSKSPTEIQYACALAH